MGLEVAHAERRSSAKRITRLVSDVPDPFSIAFRMDRLEVPSEISGASEMRGAHRLPHGTTGVQDGRDRFRGQTARFSVMSS